MYFVYYYINITKYITHSQRYYGRVRNNIILILNIIIFIHTHIYIYIYINRVHKKCHNIYYYYYFYYYCIINVNIFSVLFHRFNDMVLTNPLANVFGSLLVFQCNNICTEYFKLYTTIAIRIKH